MDKEFRGRGGDTSTDRSGADGAGRIIVAGKEAARSKREGVGSRGEVHSGRRTIQGQGVDGLTTRRDDLGAIKPDIARRRGEGQGRGELRKRQRAEPDASIIDGEAQVVCSRQGIERASGERPCPHDTTGVRGEPSGCSSEERIGPHGARTGHESEGGIGGACEATTEIDGGRTEASATGVGAQHGRSTGEGKITQGHRSDRAASANELEGASVEIDGYATSEAVGHRLDAGIIPAKQAIADANRVASRHAGEHALIRERHDAAHDGRIARELIIVANGELGAAALDEIQGAVDLTRPITGTIDGRGESGERPGVIDHATAAGGRVTRKEITKYLRIAVKLQRAARRHDEGVVIVARRQRIHGRRGKFIEEGVVRGSGD